MPTVAELVFGLTYGAIDDKPLKDAKDKAKDAADETEEAWVKTGKNIATGLAAAAVAATALFKFVDSSTAAADAVAKGARNAGLAADEYQRLAHAAELSDVSTQTLGRTIQTLNKSIIEADQGGAKPFREALQSIGLTTDDLRGTATENLGTLFDALNTVSDEGERSALAIQLLGRGGREMGSLIGEGSEGLRRASEEAEELGIHTEEALRKSEEFQDSLTRLEHSAGNAAQEIGIALAPAIQGVIDDVRVIASELGDLTDGLNETSDAVEEDESSWGSWVLYLGGPVYQAVLLITSAIEFVADSIRGVDDAVDDAILNAQRQAKEARDLKLREQRDAEQTERRRKQRERDEKREIEESIAGPGLVDPRTGRRTTLRAVQQREGRGRGGRRRQRAADFTAEDFEQLEAEEALGAQIDTLAASVGATEVQRQAALEAATASIERGASPNVAVKAAQSTLESLTGGKARTSDPTLSSLLGTNVPDVELSTLARGAEPQVLVSNIYNTFTFSNDFDIDGAGDPVAVAERTVDVMRSTWQDQINQATKTVKVDFAR